MHSTELKVTETVYNPDLGEYEQQDDNYLIHHNGDWSGEVVISLEVMGTFAKFAELPSQLIFAIAAEAVRQARAERLERLEWFHILGLPEPPATQLPPQ